jgi:hypothetical protein
MAAVRPHIRLTRLVVSAIVFAVLFETAFIDGYSRDELYPMNNYGERARSSCSAARAEWWRSTGTTTTGCGDRPIGRAIR